MTARIFDIVILGSGFGGSLLSSILAKSGFSVALIDRTRHPRFSIGESSTPLADDTLASIAEEFELPEIVPFTRYGLWKETHPTITCGLKRGFSYFGHRRNHQLHPGKVLLVAASASDAHSDTHWLRSDVDAFFYDVARKNSVQTWEDAEYKLETWNGKWKAAGTCGADAFSVITPFVVDTTGEIFATLRIPEQTEKLTTRSHAYFAHFEHLAAVTDVLAELGCDQASHPFPCDAAAVHHVLDDGWMWQLRFDDDTVSTGLVCKGVPDSRVDVSDNEAFWQRQLRQYPTLARQFAAASIVRPGKQIIATGRLQRLSSQASGSTWATLPSTAGFVDPLHSTGIAHTLFGVRRLARILTCTDQSTRTANLKDYSDAVLTEIRLVDELVEGCYASLPDFELWSAWCMIYFAAVTSMEQDTDSVGDVSFLRANDDEFRLFLKTAREKLQTAINNSSQTATSAFVDWLRSAIGPWNHVGLLEKSVHGMYARTAAPRPA